MRRSILPYLLIALPLAGCEPDPLGPRDEPGDSLGEAITLDVLGRGTVTERYTAEVAARGAWAYTTTWNNRAGTPGNAVKVWSIAGDAPALVDSLIVENASTLGDVQISDDGALLVVATERQNGSIVLYDLADPARPVRLARHMSDATRATGVHTVKLSRIDGRLFAFLSVNSGGNEDLPPRLVVVDITDPRNPDEVLAMPIGRPYFIHDVFVRDGILFTALWHAGLSIWDIGGGGAGGTPANPVLLGNVRTVNGYVHNVWWYHTPDGSKRYAFVGEEGPGSIGASSAGDIHVVDVSDLRNPVEVAFYGVTNAGTHNFVMDEAAGILYAAYYNGGVRALDVRGDLAACEASARAADGRCNLRLMGREIGIGLQDQGAVSVWGVAKIGDVVYASDMLSGLWALDVSELDAR